MKRKLTMVEMFWGLASEASLNLLKTAFLMRVDFPEPKKAGIKVCAVSPDCIENLYSNIPNKSDPAHKCLGQHLERTHGCSDLNDELQIMNGYEYDDGIRGRTPEKSLQTNPNRRNAL